MSKSSIHPDWGFRKRLMREREESYPGELFKLACTNVIVANYLKAWEYGHCTWEKCLIAIILALAESNDLANKRCLELLQKMPPTPIFIKKDT